VISSRTITGIDYKRLIKKETMAGKKKLYLLLLIICVFSTPQNHSPILASQNELPEQMEFRRHFHCYNCNVDWNALADLKNNSILIACMTGATREQLESLLIPDLTARLQELQRGNLIIKNEDAYELAFPAIIGTKRAKLQEAVEHTASALLPVSEEIIQKIIPHLQGREDMLYHVLWSIVMDGVAWITVKTELGEQLNKDNVSIRGISWVMYPNHPYDFGTNTYDDLQIGKVKITWSTTTALTPSAPWVLHETIKKYDNQLTQSLTTGQPIKNQQARQDLAQYGLVDDKGQLTAYIIDTNSQAAQIFYQLGLEFGRKAMAHLDVQKITDLLDVTPEQALVIAYHEICYEILKKLATKETLQVPEIVLKSEAGSDQTYRLISIISISDPNSLEQLYQDLGL